MKLNKIQIEILYDFTRQHFVEHYDLQTELVDHLANGIEAQWRDNPQCSFDKALQTEFNKFGVHGFADIIQKKHDSLIKSYLKIVLKFIREWFRLPKFFLTLSLIGLFYWSFTSDFSKIFIIIDFSLICLFFAFGVFYNVYILKRRKSRGKKIFVLHDIILRGELFAVIIPLFPLSISFFEIDNPSSLSSFSVLLLATFSTFIYLLGFVSIIIIPKKAEELLKETYPEYKFEKSM
ncbi:hypothetical protein GTQ40_11780 [Flavobacteriaceae bacterium R38]|nr:hypothetical protein [Flavobacteriaceae bacterium R38]